MKGSGLTECSMATEYTLGQTGLPTRAATNMATSTVSGSTFTHRGKYTRASGSRGTNTAGEPSPAPQAL